MATKRAVAQFHITGPEHPPVGELFAHVAVVHAALELIVVFGLFFGGYSGVVAKFESSSFWIIFLLVGLGTVIHSSVDYILSLLVWRPIRKLKSIRSIAAVH